MAVERMQATTGPVPGTPGSHGQRTRRDAPEMRRLVAVAVLTVLCVVAAGAVGPAARGATTPAAASGPDPSGRPMPVGDLPGWHQVFADNFASDAYPIGSLTGCDMTGCTGTPRLRWGAVPDGHADTSGHCQYYPSRTVSFSGGVLDIFLHTEPGGTCLDASLYPRDAAPMSFGRYSVRFRADAVAGYKGIFFLWPVDHVHGEIDFPEADLDAPIHGFLHPLVNRPRFQRFVSTASWTSWHTATLEWTPARVTFILDGVSLGTTRIGVPQTPMTLAVRGESQLLGAPRPPPAAQGRLQVDWVTIYSYAPG